MSLAPVEIESTTCSTLDTRTPSRLTFNEKVEKFRRISSFGLTELHVDIEKAKELGNLADQMSKHEGPRGIITSTPAVSRTIQTEKV